MLRYKHIKTLATKNTVSETESSLLIC